MKTKKLLFIFCIFSGFIFCNFAAAATELWSYDGWTQVRQILPDGKGGCAFVRLETNLLAEVVWLDKKGELIYKTNINVTNTYGTRVVNILFFNKKNLFIGDVRNAVAVVIEVDTKGQETIIQHPGENVGNPLFMLYTPSELSDKRGFFVMKTDIVTHRQRVVRFSNK